VVTARMTLRQLQRLLPDAHIEEVGDRRELVIYTGLATATYDPNTDQWTNRRYLVPMTEDLD
jgi:hypothetical protein